MNDYKNKIRHFLDLYYDGKSSADEEAILRQYFAGDDVDEEFADDKLFFDALNDDSLVEVPSDMEKRLGVAVDSWQESERVAGDRQKRFRVIRLLPSLGVAASIAILFIIGGRLLNNAGQTHEPVDTYSDPMEAYAETQRVLTLFAGTLEKGMAGIDAAEQGRDKAFAVAMEQLNKI